MQHLILAMNTGTMNLIMILLMFVVMYFFMILPQMKKSKAQKKFWSEIKKGDYIVTTGGIHGKITEIKETTVIIEIESGVKIKIEKSSISLELSQAAQK